MSESRRGFWAAIGEMGRAAPKSVDIQAQEILEQAISCVDSKAPRHARLAAGAALAATLRGSPPATLAEALAALAAGMGVDKEAMRSQLAAIDWADVDAARIEADIRAALGSKRRELFQLWLSMDGALEFLVWLRARANEARAVDDAVEPLALDLDHLMRGVFAQGLLRTRRVSWRSSAMELDKIMSSSRLGSQGLAWKARLDVDRRVFAVSHSGWAHEPLAFVALALTRGSPKGLAALLDAPALDPALADCAVFYAIDAPSEGLRGISFGEDLIRKAIEEVRRELPKVKTFCALSPIPGFGRWMAGLGQARFEELAGADLLERLARKMGAGAKEGLVAALGLPGWESTAWAEGSRDILERLCAKYLSSPAGPRRDPVAKFHVENGARLESLRPLADLSPKGLAQSFGMMAVYVYDVERMAKNKIEHPVDWDPSAEIRRLAQG